MLPRMGAAGSILRRNVRPLQVETRHGAGQLGLDYEKLKADSTGPAVAQQAASMDAEAQQREVPGTPTFFVQVGDDEPYQVSPGSFAIEEFRTILDDALAG